MIEVTENIIQISQENDVINVSVVEQPIEIVANNVVYRESPTDKTPYWGFIEGNLPDQTDLVLEFEKKANISHEHATSDVTGLDAKLTSYDTHVANSVVHVTQTNKDYWDSKAAGDHNHNTVYEPKNSNIQTHISTSTIHVSIADRLSWDGKAAFIHYHSYNDLTDKPNLTLKANQTALDATNANVTALQAVSHSHSNSAALATVINTGDGTKFHANDGTYKTITSGGSWGSITGTLSTQTDLATALSQKALQSDLVITNSNVSSLSTTVSTIQTDLDTAETNILALQTGKADKTEIPTVPSALSSFTKDINFDERYYTETEIDTALSGKAPTVHYHTLAGLTEKSYLSLTDKPTIPTVPTVLSGFTNDLTVYYLKTETYTQTEINGFLAAKEPSLGNPTTNGMVLSSTVGGTRSWIEVSSGGLTNFTEARTITAPNATIPVHSIKATGTEANIDFAIVPKGTGAILAQIPNNSASGGNKRGNYAVDFQRSRSTSSKVAFGSYSFIGNGLDNYAGDYAFVGCGQSNMANGQHSAIGGGQSNTASNSWATVGGGKTNTASGQYSFVGGGQSNTASDLNSFVGGGWNNTANGSISCVAGGYYNTASGQYSFVAGGHYTYSYLYGQTAIGNINATSAKVRQDSKITMQGSTATATAAEIFIYSTIRAVLKNNCAWAFDITILAHSSTNVLHTARFKRSGLILRGATAATTTLEGAVQTIGTDIINSNLAGCAVAISADTTNGSLKVEVTGIAATTIVWQAKIELVEIEI